MLSESQERMVIVAKQGREQEVLDIFQKWDLDAAVIGQVTDTGRVRILEGGKVVADLPVDAAHRRRARLRPAHRAARRSSTRCRRSTRSRCPRRRTWARRC